MYPAMFRMFEQYLLYIMSNWIYVGTATRQMHQPMRIRLLPLLKTKPQLHQLLLQYPQSHQNLHTMSPTMPNLQR